MPGTQLWTHTPGVYITRECTGPRTVHVAASCPDSMQRSEPWRVEDFELHKQLYKGKASLLYKAVCKVSGTFVALKLYRKARLSQLNWYQVQREIRIHSQLQHEHIVAFYAAFEDSEHVYLALEYAAGGDLYEELKRRGGSLSEEKVARDILGPCLSAVGYLHQKGFIWRDCKPENILVSGKGGRGRVMLADFGLSIDATEERPVTRAGTLDYMAPEVVMCPEKSHPQENKEKALLGYTQAVDAWALGVLAYELIVGHPPFERETRTDTYEQIMYRRPHYPTTLSEAPRSFISAALTKSARKRPSVEELRGHPWVALPRALEVKAAVSDGASLHAVQLPPPELGALATQVLKKYASMKEAKGAPVYNITVNASLQRHPLQEAAPDAHHLSSAGQDLMLDMSPASISQQEAAKQDDTQSSQESSLHTLIQWAGSSVQRLSSRLLSNGAPAQESAPRSADTSLMEEDAPLQLDMLSEADTRRSSSSSEGSLAALFYPPLPHDQVAARDAASPWSEFRHSDMSKAPLTDSALPGAGQPLDDSIRAHHGFLSAEATPAGKAALAAVLRPPTAAQDDTQGDKTPEKLPQRRRQDSNASLMDTPEPRTLVKFPSQRAGRPSGIARALSFWSPQPDVLSLE